MVNRGAASSSGLAPDAPPHPGEWREPSGVAFAVARREAGKPGDPLLFALLKAHRRLHDGRRVDAAERERIAEVVVAPRRLSPVVPMVETAPDDEAPAELAPRLKRRSRIAALVPAGEVTGWVPQWKRATEAQGAPEPVDQLRVNGPEISAFDRAAPLCESPSHSSIVGPVAPATAADAPAHLPPCAGASVSVAGASAKRQSAPAASHQGGQGARAARQRPAAAPASVPPSSPAAAERDAVPGKARPSIEHIVAVAERAVGLAPGAIRPESRLPAVVEARHTALWLAFTLRGFDYARLGAAFGRDRTSVRHSIATIAARRAADEAFADRLDDLLAEARAEPRARLRKIAP